MHKIFPEFGVWPIGAANNSIIGFSPSLIFPREGEIQLRSCRAGGKCNGTATKVMACIFWSSTRGGLHEQSGGSAQNDSESKAIVALASDGLKHRGAEARLAAKSSVNRCTPWTLVSAQLGSMTFPSRTTLSARTARKPFPEHLPRERVIVPGTDDLSLLRRQLGWRKLGETVTETLEVIPRQWKVIQYVREKFTCRNCEKISQAPAPFHVTAKRLGRSQSSRHDPVREVWAASAAQPPSRTLRQRRCAAQPVDLVRSGLRSSRPGTRRRLYRSPPPPGSPPAHQNLQFEFP